MRTHTLLLAALALGFAPAPPRGRTGAKPT
jgi:hypothetical protein